MKQRLLAVLALIVVHSVCRVICADSVHARVQSGEAPVRQYPYPALRSHAETLK